MRTFNLAAYRGRCDSKRAKPIARLSFTWEGEGAGCLPPGFLRASVLRFVEQIRDRGSLSFCRSRNRRAANKPARPVASRAARCGP